MNTFSLPYNVPTCLYSVIAERGASSWRRVPGHGALRQPAAAGREASLR